jgi:multidrug efflux pump subunit AcrB
MLRSVIAALVRFRLLLMGLAAALIVLGVLSLRNMHNDVLPELGSGPVLEVQTEALGLSSTEVEQYITVPLENNLLDGVMGVWDVRSDSIPGLSKVDLYFEPSVSILHARQLVQERLTNAFALPNVSKPPQLIQPLSSSSRVMMIGLSSKTLSPLELSYLARWVVKPRLSGVAGVANVAIFGQRDRQIQVLVDPAKLAADHITLGQIIQTAGNAQLVSPLTYLEGSSPGTGGFLDGPNQRLEIRPVLPLGAPHDLASVPINGTSGTQKLGSVATVRLGNQPLIGDALTRSGQGLVLLVQKLPSASVTGVTKGVEHALSDLRPALSGVTIDSSLFRPAGYVTKSINNLELAAIIAAALVLLALGALFLQVRSAFVALVSVALSLLAAAVVLDLLGYTLNSMVILGLLVALGVVVDDAVGGTSEIVARIRRQRPAPSGERLERTVIDAVAPLRGTLGFATLIVLLCAVPPFFSKGISATFVHPMLLSYALAVIASTVVALTITPALGILLFERGTSSRRELPVARAFHAGYRWVGARALRIKRPLLIAVCLLGLVGIVAPPFVGEPAPPTYRDHNLVIQWDGPAGASLAEMHRVTRRLIADLRALPGVGDAGATLGRAVSADQIVDTGSGEVFVKIRQGADYNRTLGAIERVAYTFPGIAAHVCTYESDVMSGVLKPVQNQATVRIYGEDYGVLGRLAGRVAAAMSGVDGLGAPHVQAQRQEPNIEVRVNDAAALRAGVLPGDARRQASTLVSGLTVGNFFQDQAVFDVVVRGVPSVQSSVDRVRDLLIDTSNGGHVRLGDIARVTVRSDPLDIQHQALSRYVDITAPVVSGTAGDARAAINARLRSIRFPFNYHAETLGGTPEDATSRATFLSFVLAGAVGILLLMQAAFGSWRLAALFFLVLPVSLSGAIAVALATGELGSLGTYAGLLGVFAFAARQGMLLISRVGQRHADDGGPLCAEIVLDAAGERFAPALASALTFAVALMPFVVMGGVEGNELTRVAAAVMLGGLASSTLLNMLLLPAICLSLGPTEPVSVEEPQPEVLQPPAISTPSSP